VGQVTAANCVSEVGLSNSLVTERLTKEKSFQKNTYMVNPKQTASHDRLAPPGGRGSVYSKIWLVKEVNAERLHSDTNFWAFCGSTYSDWEN
jgi:hypothetical protein